MKLVDRITQGNVSANSNGNARTASIIGNGNRRSRSVLADGFQQLKLAVHNRLFETLDVSRLESLEQNMASAKVTQAISEILTEEGRLLTEPDRLRLVEEIKNELLGLGPLSRCFGTKASAIYSSTAPIASISSARVSSI